MIRIFPILCAALLLGGCATRHKTYLPPDPGRVNAATKQVEEDLVKAQTLSRDARKFVDDAQKNADTIAVQSASLETKAEKLEADVPEAFKAQARELLKGIREQIDAEGDLSRNLAGAQEKNDALEAHLTQTDAHVATLKTEQTNYFSNAQKLAAEATFEREARIKAEKQLFQQKVFGWVWKIGLGIVGIAILGGLFLWLTGRIAIGAGKIMS